MRLREGFRARQANQRRDLGNGFEGSAGEDAFEAEGCVKGERYGKSTIRI